MRTSSIMRLAVVVAGLAMPAAAFALEGGIREVPAKDIPVPTADVSPQEQAVIGAALPPFWNDHPKDAAAWKALINMRADAIVKTLPGLRDKLVNALERARHDMQANGALQIDVALAEGNPCREILRFAREGSFDLIVLGTHGRTGLNHALLGSVAERVVRLASCAVMTVHLSKQAHESQAAQ